MTLRELEAQFLRWSDESTFHFQDEFAGAQSIMFLCPGCYARNGGAVGTHSILVSFEGAGVPPEYDRNPRWVVSGTGLDDLTLSPSISLGRTPGCGWHGFIQHGRSVDA